MASFAFRSRDSSCPARWAVSSAADGEAPDAFARCPAVDLRLRSEGVSRGEPGENFRVAVAPGFDRSTIRLDRTCIGLRMPFGEAGVTLGDPRCDQGRVAANTDQASDAIPLCDQQGQPAHEHDQQEPAQRRPATPRQAWNVVIILEVGRRRRARPRPRPRDQPRPLLEHGIFDLRGRGSGGRGIGRLIGPSRRHRRELRQRL